MSHSIRTTRRFTRGLRSAFAGSSLALGLGACSGNVVNLGEGQTPLTEPPPSYSRCSESPTVEGDVIVTEQAQLDELAGCQTIHGDLSVQPPLDPDLRPLHSLTTVTGVLSFVDDPRLRDEGSGDEALGTGWISSLEGLESLELVGSLRIISSQMPDLQPLVQLRALTGAGELYIDIGNIHDLAPFANLRGIHSLSVRGEQLESIADLTVPERLEELTLVGSGLTELGSLHELRRVSGTVDIDEIGVRDLTDFSSLEDVGHLSIMANAELRSLAGLEQLTGAKSIDLSRNPVLEDISALSNLRSETDLSVSSNARLRQIPNFPTWSGNSLAIIDNPALEQVALAGETNSLANFYVHQAMSLAVWGNPLLEHFTVPAGWERANSVLIAGNAQLRDLDLGALGSLDELVIKGNPLLTQVARERLDAANVLSVVGNPELSLAQFDGLQIRLRELSSEPIPALDCSSTNCYPRELEGQLVQGNLGLP